MKFILGKKLGMTRFFDKNGAAIGVTIVNAGPCVVTQIKTDDKEGYSAMQIGYSEARHINKPMAGHLKKTDAKSKKIKEIRLNDMDGAKIGDIITVEIFKTGDKVAISGIGKGKGFSGVVKRHHFRGGPETHGSDQHRAPGSIGAQQPQHVLKGRRMAGHMGSERNTIKNLEIIDMDVKNNLLAIKGAVPGSYGTLLEIRTS